MRHLALVPLVLVAFLLPAAADAACVKAQKVEFASGVTPTGAAWKAEAGVKKNGGCGSDWLFQVEFEFEGAFHWGSGTGIPVGGHTSSREGIEGDATPIAMDGSESAAFGYVGGEVTTVKLTLTDGTALELQPRYPAVELRSRYAWMRGFRYFIDFYPGDSKVETVRLFNDAGTLVSRDLHTGGSL